MSFASYRDRKAVAVALKAVYTAVDADAAEVALAAFEESDLAARYPAGHCAAMHERGPRAQNQQEAPAAQDLSILAQGLADHTAKPGPPLGIMLRMTLSGSGCVDITYIPMRRGFLYLVAIMDRYSRKVLSWRLSNSMDAGSCVEALKEALAKYGPPEIFNSPSRALLRNTLPGS